jgi:hypothetical protein
VLTNTRCFVLLIGSGITMLAAPRFGADSLHLDKDEAIVAPAVKRALSYYHFIHSEPELTVPETYDEEMEVEKWESSMPGLLRKMAAANLEKKQQTRPYKGFLTAIVAEEYWPVDTYTLEVKKSFLAEYMPGGNL